MVKLEDIKEDLLSSGLEANKTACILSCETQREETLDFEEDAAGLPHIDVIRRRR